MALSTLKHGYYIFKLQNSFSLKDIFSCGMFKYAANTIIETTNKMKCTIKEQQRE